MDKREALEAVALDSGDHVEIRHRGCAYQELRVTIASATFASLKTVGDIDDAAGHAMSKLQKLASKSIDAYPFDDVAAALLRASRLNQAPPLESVLNVSVIEA